MFSQELVRNTGAVPLQVLNDDESQARMKGDVGKKLPDSLISSC